jgi:hypothetical protein
LYQKVQKMTGKFGTSSSVRPGTPLERKFSTFENYQTRVAEEGALIINEKLRTKITELDELCLSGKYNISRLSEIREYTTTAVQQYLDDVKRLEKAEAKKGGGGGGNPLLQMLMGGAAPQGESEQGEEMYNPEEDQENEEIAMPRRLLLSRMGLDEDNKINLKLSLELELPESAKEAQKAKKAELAEQAEKAEIEAEKTKKREAEEKEAEEPEPKKAKRTTRHSKKGKKNSKKAEEEEEIEEFEAFEAIDKADNKESSMSVTENEKSVSKTKKNEEEEEEEEDEEFPVLRSHPEIYKLSTELRRHIDVILDWISTVVQWIQSGMTRNKNIGGAYIKTEIQTAMLEELGGAMQEFTSYKEIMGAYYISRAAVLEKYVKSPEFEDYKNFLIDEDEKQFIQIRTIAIGMRNTTVNLFDGLTKQSETIFNFDNNDKQDNYAAFSMY